MPGPDTDPGAIAGDTARLMMPLRAAKLLEVNMIEGYIPAVITPPDLMKILGVKSANSIPSIPRCYLRPGSKKYVYLASDVLDYLRSQKDATEIDLD